MVTPAGNTPGAANANEVQRMIKRGTKDPWLPCTGPDGGAALRLFCFAHAGGSAMVFRPWLQQFESNIEVIPVQLPGHGGRPDALMTRVAHLTDAAADVLAPYLDRPFALFGHSMGALLAFELAHRLRERLAVEPAHLFISGRRGPERPHDAPVHALPHDKLVEELRSMNGTPRELLENPELLELIIPVFRADAEVSETYEYQPHAPLRCPITVMGGLGDTEVTQEDLKAWKGYTGGQFRLRMFPGDHFYLYNKADQVIEILRQELLPVAVSATARRGGF